MVTPPSLVPLRLLYKCLVLGLRAVEVAHVARRDHGLHLSAEHALDARYEVDLVIVGILEDLVVEEDLVGFAEAELQLILVEQLFVSLSPSQYIPSV
jgi:hypothetical protein